MKKDNVFVRIKNSIYNVRKIYEYSTYGLDKALLYTLLFCLLIGIVSLAGFNKSKLTSISSFCNSMSNIISDNNVEVRNGEIDTNGNKIKKEVDDYYIYMNEDISLKDSDDVKINSYSTYTVLFLKDGIRIELDDTMMDTEWKYSDFLGNSELSSERFTSLLNSAKVMSIVIVCVSSVLFTFINYFISAMIAAFCVMTCNIIFKTRIRFGQMFSLTIYAATLPTIMVTLFNLFRPDVNFAIVCLLGTIIYSILIIKEISKNKIDTNV